MSIPTPCLEGPFNVTLRQRTSSVMMSQCQRNASISPASLYASVTLAALQHNDVTTPA
ncbi:hypothetical protein AGABI1DRAFT_134849 [Agaricus bisporus var. burnettii JB137-S8]|uniref:Uncharacterized protein n=1 Tax=Agaricus bisporus var. burnettii (strain JB137-S8 / ATCC MYA-4627 / FGSC 10392) TaxID=597362 RepID=K5VGC8_AGABU|nr:uncharacterized protein AGABI1DRAFT_134849 [Agaricus bisporus var. burnettii JB137-S8]EKM73399.1 hypothetical protein AGABI1DRAFT_134849 [Agaricus bisporus var. burnettii JB137-S8]